VVLGGDQYLVLESRGRNPTSILRVDRSQEDSWMCRECHRPLPGIAGIDIRIFGRQPRDVPLTHISMVFLILCRRDLLDVLGEEVTSDFCFGNVRNENDVLLEDWVTLHCRHRAVIRGSIDAGFRLCSICGHPIYYAGGSRYLCPAPPSGVAVFESDARLIVRRSLVSSVDFSKWPKLRVTEVRVFNKPKDGLGEISPVYSTADFPDRT